MHKEILSFDQVKLIPLINEFASNFGLIGGTAVALQIGHRRSIDFDLITLDQLRNEEIREIVKREHSIDAILVDETKEFTLAVDGVKITFLQYPFKIELENKFYEIQMPDLPTLAALKAFALGRRAKWKDYVDLYFIITKYSFKEVVKKAEEVFGKEFNEKLFREQLVYFKDIDYSESIDYMPGFYKETLQVQKSLEDISLQR